MSNKGKKTEELCEFDRYPEYYKRLHYVEDTMLKLLVELFNENGQQNETDEYLDRADPREMDLYHLSIDDLHHIEVEQMRQCISKLARKISSRYSLRYKRAKRGNIDLRRTIQHAFSNSGGIPMKLRHKDRIISRPEIILICDVSESVANFSQFMLQLVYTIQNRFNFVRSFLFVDLIDEATSYFQDNDVEQAIGNALNRAKYSSGVFSDYGRVFDIFVQKYLPGISRRSTVIILGDARNNNFPTYGRSFEKIAEHVKKVVWLNPQLKEEWYSKDNIMDVYEPLCDQVFECKNLIQLERAMEELV